MWSNKDHEKDLQQTILIYRVCTMLLLLSQDFHHCLITTGKVTVSSMMVSFKGYNVIEIIDHLVLHFQIKHTVKVVCLVGVILELLSDDDINFSVLLVQDCMVSHHKSHCHNYR